MGNILIIKDNEKILEIRGNAKSSYEKSEEIEYYCRNKHYDTEKFTELAKTYNEDNVTHDRIMLVTYDQSDSSKISEMFLGIVNDITCDDKNILRIKYVMMVHITNGDHTRAIEGIIEKIDLNLEQDFGEGKYILVSDMQSLYQEIDERIKAAVMNDVSLKNASKVSDDCYINEVINVTSDGEFNNTYRMSVLAQTDAQAYRIYDNGNIAAERNEYQRDRERVVNCKAFRRLVDKAQIFGSEKGDYYRTRMTHSLEVNQIAKAIAYALGLNLDLTEAIALGHDIGHTPFGHQGERTLDAILHGKINIGIAASDKLFDKNCFGGFKHNYQSARVLAKIEEKYTGFSGLNVSAQVIEGVLKHTKLDPQNVDIRDFLSDAYLDKIHITGDEKQICSNLEGQTVAIADEIAQRGHDVDDALTSGVMSVEEFLDRLHIGKCKELYKRITDEIKAIDSATRLIYDRQELKVARIVSVIVNYFITATIKHSLQLVKNYEYLGKIDFDNQLVLVEFSPEAAKVNDYLEHIVQRKVICNSEVARADYNAGMIIQTLFQKYYANPRLLHSGTVHKIFVETLTHKNKNVANSAVNLGDTGIKLADKEINAITKDGLDYDAVYEYISNSSVDRFDDERPDIILFEKRKILVRCITDYIAGMTDGYALEEYEKLI